MKFIIALYTVLIGLLVVYSYGFVDPNLTLSTNVFYQKFHQPLSELTFHNRPLSTAIFVFLILLFTIYYLLFLWLAAKKRLNFRKLKWLIGIIVGILFLSFPAFSYDIFNYILTAKITFLYKENPYMIMPIEILGEPNLAFTRAANKIALYGPSWIGLSFIPHILGLGNILLTIFSFKALMIAFYLGVVWVIGKISKDPLSVVLFAFNPVVIIETLVSAHNDVVMMFLALLAFYFLKQKRFVVASIALLLSVLIKYSTIALIPVFIYTTYLVWQNKKVDWGKIYLISALSMLAVFLTAPIREEIYSWYVIWMLGFAVLIPKSKVLLSLVITLSLSTLLRYIPVLYTGSYFGITPMAKEILTFVPIGFLSVFWLCKKFLVQRSSR